ncbi:spore germination protein [Paenibacillus hexagrammi]|uniref:spore germination protein n=1 Tax=Paenibacillus hexagrammi TaxID=2908839 RepID=UPI0021A30374|nr:spore germination protein [Paenibacillus sp. YPD9-1]
MVTQINEQQEQTASRETFEWIVNSLGESPDIVHNCFSKNKQEFDMVYISSLTEEQRISDTLLVPFYQSDSFESFIEYVESLPNVTLHRTCVSTLEKMLRGHAALYLGDKVYLVDLKLVKNNKVRDAAVENVVQGPKDGLSEDIAVNLNLIRCRYPRTTLMIEHREVGTVSRTPLALIYDEECTDPKVVEEVKKSLDRIDADIVQAVNQLSMLMTSKKRTIFPTMLSTERPDRVAFNLNHGKVVLLLQEPLCTNCSLRIF